MIKFTHRGDFNKAERFMRESKRLNYRAIVEKYAVEGVKTLSSVTPKDTGLTSQQWDYEISFNSKGFTISWTNSNLNDGIPIVILLQYGHGTRSGSFVEGQDFINPAMRPLFDKIAENLWKEVNSL